MQWLGTGVEATVGLWLVSGYARRGAWLAGLALFTLLAGVSGYFASVGQASCGCFGQVAVSPWVSLTLNAVCTVILLVGRPASDGASLRRTIAGYSALVVCGVVVLVGAGSSTGDAWLARLGRESLAVVPGQAEASEAEAGAMRAVRVEIVNRSNEDVRLLGGSVSCACMAADGLPLTVPARGRAEVEVKIKFNGSPGRFVHRFEFYTALPDQPKVTGRLTGTVLESRP